MAQRGFAAGKERFHQRGTETRRRFWYSDGAFVASIAAGGAILGICAGREDSTRISLLAIAAEGGVRPQLKGSVAGDGTITIKFAKKNYSGVLPSSRRGSEIQFTLMAKQLGSPLLDDRPNLASGVAETREYRAQYFKNDTAVGQMSDILVLTVPASGSAGSGGTVLKVAA